MQSCSRMRWRGWDVESCAQQHTTRSSTRGSRSCVATGTLRLLGKCTSKYQVRGQNVVTGSSEMHQKLDFLRHEDDVYNGGDVGVHNKNSQHVVRYSVWTVINGWIDAIASYSHATRKYLLGNCCQNCLMLIMMLHTMLLNHGDVVVDCARFRDRRNVTASGSKCLFVSLR
jgi:hypothetical protein